MPATKPRAYLPLTATAYEIELHMESSPTWEKADSATSPVGYEAYKHVGCAEIVHAPVSFFVGSYERCRAVMDICMTEFLGDPDASEDDRRALIHHLSGIVQVKGVNQWAAHQALGYIRSLSEEPEPESYDDHDGSLPSFRNR
ncbi:hypothetical protein ACQEVF_59400 [Nonomuraea polychroma]|uniref:hypothetical protein n=1 Tax=Nonomuraea polychroma TaxID=46176 RepID=UPI003D93ECA9